MFDFLISDVLQTQFENFFVESSLSGNEVGWHRNIYSSDDLGRTASNLDCMNNCFNVEPDICEFFVLQNGICLYGRTAISNGTLVLPNVNATLYLVNCKKIKNKKIYKF
jgi:hypothetical protein